MAVFKQSPRLLFKKVDNKKKVCVKCWKTTLFRIGQDIDEPLEGHKTYPDLCHCQWQIIMCLFCCHKILIIYFNVKLPLLHI